ncbi:MAG: hypothetical protein IJO16_03910 [Clostridia bacterium]|nr:hypothetical protein [Clostridia bacterium]
MKRIITCILAITFLFILFYAPIYIPNEEFMIDITSAHLTGQYYDEYLTEEEIMLMEKWLPSLRPHIKAGIDVGEDPGVSYIKLYVEAGEKYMQLTVPAFYVFDVPDFSIPTRVSHASRYEYVSQNQDLTWDVYNMLQEVHARRQDNFKKFLGSKKAAN